MIKLLGFLQKFETTFKWTCYHSNLNWKLKFTQIFSQQPSQYRISVWNKVVFLLFLGWLKNKNKQHVWILQQYNLCFESKLCLNWPGSKVMKLKIDLTSQISFSVFSDKFCNTYISDTSSVLYTNLSIKIFNSSYCKYTYWFEVHWKHI